MGSGGRVLHGVQGLWRQSPQKLNSFSYFTVNSACNAAHNNSEYVEKSHSLPHLQTLVGMHPLILFPGSAPTIPVPNNSFIPLRGRDDLKIKQNYTYTRQ